MKTAGKCCDLAFRIAGSILRFRFLEMEDARFLLPSYASFHVKDAPCYAPMAVITVGENRVSFDGGGEEVGLFDCGGANHGVYRTAGGYKFLISGMDGNPACALMASVDFTRCEAALYGDIDNQRYGLNNAAMIVFAFSGARCGILLIHASVVMCRGRGYLFLGKSGTGKSTHAALWQKFIPGAELLNDDNPAVRLHPDGTVTVYGTPWSGKTPCYRNFSVPVGAFLRLQQWPQNSIFRETSLRAFASILSSCSTMVWDSPSYDAVISTVNGIVSIVPAYYLKCLPDEAAARLSSQTLASV